MEIVLQGKRFYFTDEVVAILDFHKQRKSNDHEKGGIVLGKIQDNNIIINRLSVPTELDKSSRYNFERHRLSAQIIIDYEFHNSNKQITYLGEWHTHPEDNPSPSQTDLKMIQQQISSNIIHTDFLILMIQGREKLYFGIKDKQGLNFILHV